MSISKLYSLAELEARPTISQGHFDNLKIDTGQIRIWLCRCGIADGMLYDHTITEEHLIDGRWTTIRTYQGT